ncbi:MAG: M12 family metallo-peptidase [bacterium]
MELLQILARRLRPASTSLAVLLLVPTLAGAAPTFREIAATGSVSDRYPESTRFFSLSLEDMRQILADAPYENLANPLAGLVVALPLPGGSSQDFEIWETSVMHPELAARYPEIKTYTGRGIDDRTATVRLDATPLGFHAMVLRAGPSVFIDPVNDDVSFYASHYKRSAAMADVDGEPFECHFVTDEAMETEINRLVEERAANPTPRGTGQELRTYRLALACTGEYAARFGGTVPGALAAMNISVNRVTGVYERDVSVRMELIANNDQIVYTNGATDPYTNNNGSAMLSQNQSTLDSVIGAANYDIGHVFSTGGGGIAQLGVPCRNGSKARGVTGLNNPQGDTFDIDYVAHEMGHQFGATHTFNSVTGSCGGGNRTGSTAYEPGSGVTIMGYAGICGADDIASHSIDEFHGGSLNQIVAYTQSSFGNNCPVITATSNTPPVVTAGNVGFTIPVSTPFILDGLAVDAEGDSLSYNWEEMDVGPAGSPNSPSGNAPIFRNFSSKDRSFRTFPRNVDIRDGVGIIGELLPTYTRNLTFRLTVRDNVGGVGFDQTSVAVSGLAGPFEVTSVDATPWSAGQMKLITWDVAGTDLAPINCPTVDILLSEDDGQNFTTVLLAGTPNDGSEMIVVPNVSTLEARVQIEASNNIFFNMNDTAFEIMGGGTGVDVVAVDDLQLRVQPNPFVGRTSVSFSMHQDGDVKVAVYDAAGRLVTTLLDGRRDVGAHVLQWNGRDAAGTAAAAGVYFVRLETAEGVQTTRTLLLK